MSVGWKDIKARIRSRLPIQYITEQWYRLPTSTRALPDYIGQAFNNFRLYGIKNAAALAYFAVFSIFPLTLLLAVGISSILGPAVAQEQIYEGLKLFLPEETEALQLIRDSLEEALAQGTGFGLLALVGISWSALGLFSHLSSSLDRIFQVPASRSVWKERLLAFGMTVGLIGLVTISFITSGLLRLVDAFLLTNPSVWIRIGTFFLPLGLDMIIFVVLFRYVPSRFVTWDAVWPAAIIGAVCLEAAKALFAAYLGELANFQFVYGSIAAVIILMVWAYLTATIILISAEICAQLNLWFIDREEHEQRISVFHDADLEQLPEEIPPPM